MLGEAGGAPAGEEIDDDPFFLTLPTEDTQAAGDFTAKALAEKHQLAQDLNSQLNPQMLKDEASTGNQGSHILTSLLNANALVIVPEGGVEVHQGDTVSEINQ